MPKHKHSWVPASFNQFHLPVWGEVEEPNGWVELKVAKDYICEICKATQPTPSPGLLARIRFRIAAIRTRVASWVAGYDIE